MIVAWDGKKGNDAALCDKTPPRGRTRTPARPSAGTGPCGSRASKGPCEPDFGIEPFVPRTIGSHSWRRWTARHGLVERPVHAGAEGRWHFGPPAVLVSVDVNDALGTIEEEHVDHAVAGHVAGRADVGHFFLRARFDATARHVENR